MFMRKFKFRYPKNVMLDMLSFDWFENGGMVGIDYLQEYLSTKDITQRIFDNLEKGNNNKYVLKNYILYCQQKKLKEIIPYAINIIISFNKDSDEVLRNSALEVICKMAVSLDELEQLLKNENFLKTFNSFYYPDSKVKQARQIKNNDNLFFILMETDEDFKDTENFYKNKKAQSIWNRSIIFETSDRDIEDDFLSSDDGNNIKSSKFTYYSQEKDKVVNVLIKNLEEDRTEIMVICWELK